MIPPRQKVSLSVRLDELVEGELVPANLLTLRGRQELMPSVFLNEGRGGIWEGGAAGGWVAVEMPTEPVKVFNAPADVLAGMPAEARPGAGGWDEFSKPKADKWLYDNITGKGFDVIFDAIVKKVELKRISPKDKTNETVRWDVALTLERIEFKLDGRPIKLKLDSYTPSDPNSDTVALHLGDAHVTVSGDEAFARGAKKLSDGDHVTIRGTISKASTWQDAPPEIWILLRDPSLVWPALRTTAPASSTRPSGAAESPPS